MRNHDAKTNNAFIGGVQLRIKHSSYMNWSLIAIVVLLTLVSIVSVLPPVLSSHLSEIWFFSKHQMVVIVGLSLTLVLLAGLAHQMRYLRVLREQFALVQKNEREAKGSGELDSRIRRRSRGFSEVGCYQDFLREPHGAPPS